MTPHLTVACGCGRSLSIECPTLADIPPAQARMPGWGYDDHGRVKCPACLDAPAAEPMPPRAVPTLFDETAA